MLGNQNTIAVHELGIVHVDGEPGPTLFHRGQNIHVA